MLNAQVRFKSNPVFLILVLLAFRSASFAGEVASGQSRWETDIKAFEAADKINPPPTGADSFCGQHEHSLVERFGSGFSEIQNHPAGLWRLRDPRCDRVWQPHRHSLSANTGGALRRRQRHRQRQKSRTIVE